MTDIRLVISDVDGTLVTPDHVLTDRAIAAVHELGERGILFTLASSRPPRGLRLLVERLALMQPYAPFNGALIEAPNGEILTAHFLERSVGIAVRAIAMELGLELWIYNEKQWFVGDVTPYVEREEHTVGFSPVVMRDLEDTLERAVKLQIVGDPALVERAMPMVAEALGTRVSASRSKPRFLEITSATAHKGTVVTSLAAITGFPTSAIAVIGDAENDILMFERAGFRIAMGQAEERVKAAADVVTAPNTEEGFARGIEQYVLGSAADAQP